MLTIHRVHCQKTKACTINDHQEACFNHKRISPMFRKKIDNHTKLYY